FSAGEFEDILCIRPGSYVGITGYAKLVEELEEDGEVSGDSEVSVSRSPNSEGSDDSVEDSKGDSDGDSGDDSVKDSVEDSVEDSVDTLVKVSDDGSEESKLELEIISVLVLLSESVLDSELGLDCKIVSVSDGSSLHLSSNTSLFSKSL
ncbi:hypothetical protein IWW49_004202, partial [Coemansia sp. RSA 1797]